jgi:flagellar hook assembly protein FlgD
VTIGVFDVAGRLVSLIVDSEFDPGTFSVRWDGRDDSGRPVASGTYFARMSAGDASFERRMTLLK